MRVDGAENGVGGEEGEDFSQRFLSFWSREQKKLPPHAPHHLER